MKNLYLTYFEKTYAVDSSLLSIIFLLRMNFPINYEQLYSVYVNLFLNSSGRIINYLLWNQKGALWRLRLAEINKANPELFNICYLLNSFKLNKQLYDVEYFFMLDFFQNSIEKKIPEIKEISSIKGYKENINLLTHFVLYEEEGIVWNNNVLDYLSQVEKNLKMKRNEYNEFFLSFSNLMHKLEIMMDIQLIGKSEKDNIEEIFEAFKFKFNKDLNLEKVLKLNLIEIKKLDLKIIEINFLQTKLILYCLELIKNLGELSIDDVKNSKYYFLFEEGN